jgi:hypothetical protein
VQLARRDPTLNPPPETWSTGAEVRAFARALRVVFKSNDWEHVTTHAAQAWPTGSAVPWVDVAGAVHAAWADADPDRPVASPL